MSPAEHRVVGRTRHHVALGRAVRQLRARRGWSQEGLAFYAGLHRNYVGGIERGEINPTLRTLLALERGLRVPLSELMAVMERHVLELPSRELGADRWLTQHRHAAKSSSVSCTERPVG